MIDPLMHGLELPYARRFHPAGFPLELATNSPAVLEAALDSWSSFPLRFDRQPLAVRVAVADAGPQPLPPVPAFRAQRHLLAIVADAANFAVCDYTRRFGFCWTASATVADRDYFRYYLLEAVVYTLLAHCELTPVHAACVAWDGAGVLLSGPSGAGKTTLSYACARRGWTFICDDSAILPWGSPAGTMAGNPFQMRFRSDAAQVTPELSTRFAARWRNGKPTIEIPTAALSGIRTAFECRLRHLVLLDRRASGPAELRPVSRERAMSHLLQDVALSDQTVTERHLASLRGMVSGIEASELRYSGLDEAVEVLECFVRHQAQSPSRS